MTYIPNPKTAGSGIICCIPQKGECPNRCPDCFFQSGRSYLEPLSENLPNMPSTALARGKIVRVNDGNDSNVQRDLVISSTEQYIDKFYNTARPKLDFPAPVVLTVNPGRMTNKSWYNIMPIADAMPKNLMFVRVRANTWNKNIVWGVIDYYSLFSVPIVLTFMAYHRDSSIPKDHMDNYIYRKRIMNSYWVIGTKAWREYMAEFEDEKLVYPCGKIEGEKGVTACRFCGNCLREYYATMERMRHDPERV